eukprot:1483216-Rhodomonas_salina.1
MESVDDGMLMVKGFDGEMLMIESFDGGRFRWWNVADGMVMVEGFDDGMLMMDDDGWMLHDACLKMSRSELHETRTASCIFLLHACAMVHPDLDLLSAIILNLSSFILHRHLVCINLDKLRNREMLRGVGSSTAGWKDVSLCRRRASKDRLSPLAHTAQTRSHQQALFPGTSHPYSG